MIILNAIFTGTRKISSRPFRNKGGSKASDLGGFPLNVQRHPNFLNFIHHYKSIHINIPCNPPIDPHRILEKSQDVTLPPLAHRPLSRFVALLDFLPQMACQNSPFPLATWVMALYFATPTPRDSEEKHGDFSGFFVALLKAVIRERFHLQRPEGLVISPSHQRPAGGRIGSQ